MNPSQKIDALIARLGDWRGKLLADIRRMVREADPEITEEWKWMGTPVWCCDGNVCLANPFQSFVKITFARGAHLPDPHEIFNAELEGKLWRAIKLFEGDRIDEAALKELVRAGVAHNRERAKGKAPDKPRQARSRKAARGK